MVVCAPLFQAVEARLDEGREEGHGARHFRRSLSPTWRGRFLPFTLVEVLIAMALLAVVGGVVALNVRKAILQQRFRSDVSLVVHTLRLAQQLMLVFNTDVKVRFWPLPDQRGFGYLLDFEDKLDTYWKREATRPRAPLKGIHAISFGSDTRQVEIQFLSGGMVMSRGILQLSSAAEGRVEGAWVEYICLPGFPRFLESRGDPCDEVDFKKQEEEQRELGAYVMNVVQEKLHSYENIDGQSNK